VLVAHVLREVSNEMQAERFPKILHFKEEQKELTSQYIITSNTI
jgi:hypothetical protein